MTYLLLASALLLSAIAAFYAVAGLVAIFAASATSIMIMGGALEGAKLVVASWLYRNWKDIPVLMKTYFTAALVILMMLTSMGIFGYLSKAHLDQAVPTGDVVSKLNLIDEKINTQKENVNAARKAITQLDAQVDQTLARTTEASGADRSIVIRRAQQKDRARILNEIGAAQAKIAKYNEERAPIASEVRKVEAEVGPIKYIAQVIYGDADTDLLEKAVRFVTILIVLVFDPLAVLMLVAANWQLKKDKGTIEPEPVKEKVWDKFFKKEPANDFPEKEPEIKHIVIEDNIEFKDVFNPKEQDSELPEIKVDEHNKDWEPELFDRKQVKKIEYDSAGRRITPITEEELTPPTKTQSFLNKVQEVFSSPSVKTIEKEVEELQKK